MDEKYNKFVNKAKKKVSFSLLSGFWIWLILILDGDNNRDLLDVIISYIEKLN